MQNDQNNLIARPDTFFGVCEALGEDLRIPANLLRIAFAGLLFWNPLIGVGVYLAAGLLVGLTRWFYPNPVAAAAEACSTAALPDQGPAHPRSANEERMALAA